MVVRFLKDFFTLISCDLRFAIFGASSPNSSFMPSFRQTKTSFAFGGISFRAHWPPPQLLNHFRFRRNISLKSECLLVAHRQPVFDARHSAPSAPYTISSIVLRVLFCRSRMPNVGHESNSPSFRGSALEGRVGGGGRGPCVPPASAHDESESTASRRSSPLARDCWRRRVEGFRRPVQGSKSRGEFGARCS